MSTYLVSRPATKHVKQEFLAHIAPSESQPLGMYWTADKASAMEYSKYSVADACAKKMGGVVLDITPAKA